MAREVLKVGDIFELPDGHLFIALNKVRDEFRIDQRNFGPVGL